MGQLADLQAILETVLASQNVYFQPPANVQMVYPCVVYKRVTARTDFANNKPYIYTKRYQVTVIDRNPDSSFHDKIASLPQCVFDRYYVANNLHHDVFNLYY